VRQLCVSTRQRLYQTLLDVFRALSHEYSPKNDLDSQKSVVNKNTFSLVRKNIQKEKCTKKTVENDLLECKNVFFRSK